MQRWKFTWGRGWEVGYFSVQEISASVQKSRRELDNQIGLISRFITENDAAMTKIRATLTGSSVQADQKMLALLKDVESSLRESTSQLRAAKDDLSRVLQTL
jgi:phage-related tail protein